MTKFIPLHFIGFVDEGFTDEKGIYQPYIDSLTFDKIYVPISSILSFKQNIDENLNVPKLSVLNSKGLIPNNGNMEFTVDDFITYSPSAFKEAISIIYLKDQLADRLNDFIWLNSLHNPRRKINGTEGYTSFLVYESPEEIMALMKE